MSDTPNPPEMNLGRLARAGLEYIMAPDNSEALNQAIVAMNWAAMAGEHEQYEQLKAVIQDRSRPAQRFLLNVLATAAETARYPTASGRWGAATLIGVPVTVFSDHSPSKLDDETVGIIKSSLHRHGLVDASYKVNMLPWLDPLSRYITNPVQRRGLLNQLYLPHVSAVHLAKPAVEPTPDIGADKRSVKRYMRFMTLSLHSAKASHQEELRRLTDRHSPGMSAWSASLAQVLQAAGRFEAVAINGMATYSNLLEMAALTDACFKIGALLISTLERPATPPPGQLKVIFELVRMWGDGAVILVTCQGNGRPIKSKKIRLPRSVWPDQADNLVHAICETAQAMTKRYGVDAFEIIGELPGRKARSLQPGSTQA